MTGTPGGEPQERPELSPSTATAFGSGAIAVGRDNLGIINIGDHAVNTLFALPAGGLVAPQAVRCPPGLVGLPPSRHGLFVGRGAAPS